MQHKNARAHEVCIIMQAKKGKERDKAAAATGTNGRYVSDMKRMGGYAHKPGS